METLGSEAARQRLPDPLERARQARQLASLSPPLAIRAARLQARDRLHRPDAEHRPDAGQLSTAPHRAAVALVRHDRDVAGCSDRPILPAQA